MMGPASCWQRRSSSCRVSLACLWAHLPRQSSVLPCWCPGTLPPGYSLNLADFQTTQSCHLLGACGDGAGLPHGAQAPPRGPLLGKEWRVSRLRWDWRQEHLA